MNTTILHNMKVLIFDTETTGLPTERFPSIYDSEKWPHIIQLSYIMYDTDNFVIIHKSDEIICIGDDVVLTEKSVSMHGISREISKAKGVPIYEALTRFNECASIAETLVGHNISFDKRIFIAECIRNNIKSNFMGSTKQLYCTMKNTKELCGLYTTYNNRKPYLKYPTQTELHRKLFPDEADPQGVHNSLNDVLICLRNYIKLTLSIDLCEADSSFREMYQEIRMT